MLPTHVRKNEVKVENKLRHAIGVYYCSTVSHTIQTNNKQLFSFLISLFKLQHEEALTSHYKFKNNDFDNIHLLIIYKNLYLNKYYVYTRRNQLCGRYDSFTIVYIRSRWQWFDTYDSLFVITTKLHQRTYTLTPFDETIDRSNTDFPTVCQHEKLNERTTNKYLWL